MKQTIKSIIRTVKSVKGNSLAEFATTTALMATLAATAAPKLSERSFGTFIKHYIFLSFREIWINYFLTGRI